MVDSIGPFVAAASADDPGSKEAVKVAGAIVSDLVRPTAKIVGKHWASRVEDWLESRNARRVLELAKKRVDRSSSPSEPGSAVSMRTASAILDGAVFADDEIMAEYLSGVMAAAREPDASDRGQPWASLISRLSTDQLRLHFVIYSLLRRFLAGKKLSVFEIANAQIYVPFSELNPVMGWTDGDGGLGEAFYGLHRERLVGDDDFFFGPAGMLSEVTGRRISDHGLLVKPSRAGVGLYLWGMGQGGANLDVLTRTDLDLSLVDADDPAREIRTASLVEELPPSVNSRPTTGPSPKAKTGQRKQPKKEKRARRK